MPKIYIGYIKEKFMVFLEKANLPIKKADYILVDERINEELKANISSLGIKMIFAPKAKNLTSPVRSHADIVIHHLGFNKFVCEPTLFEYFKTAFSST